MNADIRLQVCVEWFLSFLNVSDVCHLAAVNSQWASLGGRLLLQTVASKCGIKMPALDKVQGQALEFTQSLLLPRLQKISVARELYLENLQRTEKFYSFLGTITKKCNIFSIRCLDNGRLYFAKNDLPPIHVLGEWESWIPRIYNILIRHEVVPRNRQISVQINSNSSGCTPVIISSTAVVIYIDMKFSDEEIISALGQFKHKLQTVSISVSQDTQYFVKGAEKICREDTVEQMKLIKRRMGFADVSINQDSARRYWK
jgi:hypothetical protein